MEGIVVNSIGVQPVEDGPSLASGAEQPPRPSVLQCVAPAGEITGAPTGPCGDPLEFEVRADPTHPTIEGCHLERNQRP